MSGGKLSESWRSALTRLASGWRGKMELLSKLAHVAFLFFLTILFLYIIFKLGLSAYRVFSPAQQIDLEYTDSAKTDLKEELRTRWRKCLQPIRLERFQEIPLALPELPYIFKPAKKDVFQDINLKIHDVDFSSLYQKFSSVFLPSGYRVIIRKSVKDGKVEHLDMSLEYGTEVLKSWHLPRHLICEDWEIKLQEKKKEDFKAVLGEAAGNGTAQLLRDDEDFLINHAFYELYFYLYFDPDNKDHKFKRGDKEEHHQFPSGAALCAYYTGIRHLNNYQQYGNQAELNQALRFFQIFLAEYPGCWHGALLYGMALAENRDEPGAVAAYGKVIEQLGREIEENAKEISALNKVTVPSNDQIVGKQKREEENRNLTLVKLQAQLWQAMALRRHYGWKTTHKAISDLNGFITGIDKPENALIGEVNKNKLKVYAYIELASAYIDYLYIFFPNRLEDMLMALTDISAPSQVKISGVIKNCIEQSVQGLKEGRPDLIHWLQVNIVIGRIYHQYSDNISEALKVKAGIQGEASEEREKINLDCRLNNAAGCAWFLRANWEELGRQAYRGDCQTALNYLNQVQLDDPQHYTTLLNLGMIYMDPWFDPCGETLAIAHDYIWRVTLLKPNDPFGFEQLAYVYRKQAEVNGAGPDMSGIIDQGIAAAKKALALRPQSGDAFLTLAELYVMKFLLLGKTADGSEIESNIINYLNQATVLESLNPRLHWTKFVWKTAKLKRAADAAKLKDIQKEIKEQADKLAAPKTPQFRHYREKLLALAERIKPDQPEESQVFTASVASF
ncbi:hypothetical protein [Desulfobacca acetoxidans]|nr:hypothetical protein [Desulfobacca acetoxidans]